MGPMRKSLLIAEDDENILELLLGAFSQPDLRVHPARSGAEAIALIDQHDIDVVLTDLVMPDGDGLAVLSHAKRTLVHCEVILMTGYATKQTAREAREIGAMEVLQKPFSIEKELRPLILTLLERSPVRPDERPRRDPSKDGSGRG